jgi:predicted PP-loop superfamily ATPase
MNTGKLDLFYFGDIGKYDAFNPAHVCAQEYAAEILYLIASRAPYELSEAEIARLLGVEQETMRPVIDSLLRIKAIERRDDMYRICFPAFLQGDVQQMRGILSSASDSVVRTLERLKSQLVPIAQRFRCHRQFSVGRILYHVICDSVFDDRAFACFEKERLLCASKPQPGNRDYLMIGYEACEEVAQNSNLLLCSSNNYSFDGVRFNSFGDSDGRRKDMYRFMRMFASEPHGLAQFLDRVEDIEMLLSSDMESIASRCSSMVKRVVSNDVYWTDLTDDAETALLLSELGYVSRRQDDNHLSMMVPVFYPDEQPLIAAVSDIVLPQIDDAVKRAFDSFLMRTGDFTAVRHGVNIEEIGNELWHQTFGLTNERLAETGYVDQPPHIDGQGRFFRSIRMES